MRATLPTGCRVIGRQVESSFPTPRLTRHTDHCCFSAGSIESTCTGAFCVSSWTGPALWYVTGIENVATPTVAVGWIDVTSSSRVWVTVRFTCSCDVGVRAAWLLIVVTFDDLLERKAFDVRVLGGHQVVEVGIAGVERAAGEEGVADVAEGVGGPLVDGRLHRLRERHGAEGDGDVVAHHHPVMLGGEAGDARLIGHLGDVDLLVGDGDLARSRWRWPRWRR